jgi:hypothetical protein
MATAAVDFTVSWVPTRGWVLAKQRSSGGLWTKQIEQARERSSDGSCVVAAMATNKQLLWIFPLLWN